MRVYIDCACVIVCVRVVECIVSELMGRGEVSEKRMRDIHSVFVFASVAEYRLRKCMEGREVCVCVRVCVSVCE